MGLNTSHVSVTVPIFQPVSLQMDCLNTSHVSVTVPK